MKRLFTLVTILAFSTGSLFAQTIKTKVLVVGGDASAIGAAIQSARSGVETLLIEESGQLGKGLTTIDTTRKIGVQGDFIKLIKTASQQINPNSLDPGAVSQVLKNWTDTVKNLKVMMNTRIQTVEKSGKGWELRLANKQKLKTDLIVDAAGNKIISSKYPQVKTQVPFRPINIEDFYKSNLYRTSVAAGADMSSPLPIGSFTGADPENLIIFEKNGESSFSPSLTGGQAAGATAAYCAFFKTTTKNINIRVIQGELLAYKGQLIPFADINPSDTAFAAVQRIGATGILKATALNNKLYFQPDSAVTFEEIRQPMRELYSRSQIWFADNKGTTMTLNDILSLIKYSGGRGEELNREVEKGWKKSFGFEGEYDLKKTITRLQTAVLLDAYLKPFHVRVDYTGKLLY